MKPEDLTLEKLTPMFQSGGAFDVWNIVAGVLFGIIGWAALSYGRKLQLWKPIVIGLALMSYPYFIYNRWLLWGIGTGLVVTLYFHHDE